jgi:hypothetical protein
MEGLASHGHLEIGAYESAISLLACCLLRHRIRISPLRYLGLGPVQKGKAAE